MCPTLETPQPAGRRLRCALLASTVLGLLALSAPGAAAQQSAAAADSASARAFTAKDERERIGHRIRKVMAQSRYKHARWGLLVVDLQNNGVRQRAASDDFFPIASNTKLFTIAAAFEVLGTDHIFETPVVYKGTMDQSGVLHGDLILVGQGDLTMGGRRNRNGSIAFTDFDHTDANALGGAILTEPDPLAGLDDLARQVAAAGIKRIAGNVIIDDRLFETIPLREYFLAPVIINDNLIDLSIIPQGADQPALVEWRPKTSAIEVVAQVTTKDMPMEPIAVRAEKIGDVTRLTVTGQVATDALDGLLPPVRVFQIGDLPELGEAERIAEVPGFARTLFIEALQRAGVVVEAAVLGANPRESLPAPDLMAGLPRVALLVSAPYADYAKLILKVSHNLGADLSAMLIGVHEGTTNFVLAMSEMGEILEGFGLDRESFAFQDASGSASFATPRAVIDLLRAMRTRPGFADYVDALPVLGVDGSLAEVQRDSPARGQVFAKTGTLVSIDFTHLQPFLGAKALAGYIDSRKGRRLAFALVVQNGLVRNSIFGEFTELFAINEDLGKISALIWSGRH